MVEIIKDSSPVDKNKLDPNKVAHTNQPGEGGGLTLVLRETRQQASG